MASGCCTPDPLALHGSSWAQKASDAVEDDSQVDGLGSKTPSRVANLSVEALRVKLQELQGASAKCFEDIVVGPPSGAMSSANNSLDGNTTEVVMSSNLTQSLSASLPLPPPPPPPHPALHFTPQDRNAAMNAKPTKPFMQENGVSKGSVGPILHHANACNLINCKGGCGQGADCSNCNYCFWSKAHDSMRPMQELRASAGSENARPKEAQRLANESTPLPGAAEPFVSKFKESKEPFASKPKETKVVKPKLSVGSLGHPHSCAEACEYVRHKGACAYGEACVNCHANLWSNPSRWELEGYSRGASFSAVAQDVQGQEVGDGSSGTSFGAMAQDLRGSVANPAWVMSPNELLEVQTILSTSPVRGQSQEELPAPQASPNGFPWHASVGSTGHPHSCGPACKYATQSKGCKDGWLCSHCHLCRWMRYRSRSDNKQPIKITAWMSF